MKLILIAVLALFIPAGVRAQDPFGIRMGMTLTELRQATGAVADSEYKGMYHSERVPSPHAEFESYNFLVSPTTGVCKVWATGKTVMNDAYGSTLHRHFDELSEALDKKYGEHKSFDFLKVGSIWDDPNDWMMGLYKGDRVLATFWINSPTPPIARAQLNASGLGLDKGWLTLSYEFSNADKCIDELKALNNSKL